MSKSEKEMIYLGYDAPRRRTVFKYKDELRVFGGTPCAEKILHELYLLGIGLLLPGVWLRTLPYTKQTWDTLLSISESGE